METKVSLLQYTASDPNVIGCHNVCLRVPVHPSMWFYDEWNSQFTYKLVTLTYDAPFLYSFLIRELTHLVDLLKTKYQGQLDEVGGKNTKSKALVYNDIANDINASMNSKKINSAQVKNKVSALKKKVNDIRDRNNATGGDFESDADDDLTQSLLDLYGNHPAQNPIVTFNPTTAPEEFLLDEENDDDEVEIMETGGERKIPNESLPVTRHEIFEVLDSSDNCKTAEDSEDQPQLVITTNNPDPVTPPARKSAVKSNHSSDKKRNLPASSL